MYPVILKRNSSFLLLVLFTSTTEPTSILNHLAKCMPSFFLRLQLEQNDRHTTHI